MCLDAIVTLDLLEPCSIDQNQSERAIACERSPDVVESLTVMTRQSGEIRLFLGIFGAHATRIGTPAVRSERNSRLEEILQEATGQRG